MPLDRDEIERILRSEVESAFQRFKEASAEFNTVLGDVPSRIPEPDGSLIIQQAGDQKIAAIRRLRLALDRFDGFILDGRIPADLDGASGKQADAEIQPSNMPSNKPLER
jgi:hypothetical protein